MEEGKKIMGKLEWLILIVIVLLVGYLVLKATGNSISETTEKIEINSSPEKKEKDWDKFKKRKEKQYKERDQQERVAHSKLQGFIEDYRKTGNRDLQNTDIKFLEKVDEKINKSSTVGDAKSYYNFMKNSVKFYNAVDNISSSVTGTDKKKSYINKFLSVEQEKLETFSAGEPDTEEWIEFLNHN